MVIHIFKDGTITTDLKEVHVPNETVKRIIALSRDGHASEEKRRKETKKERKVECETRS